MKGIDVLCLIGVFLWTPAAAQESQEHIPSVATHLIASKHVQQTFKIQVMQPAQKKGETARFPVVFATDGDLTFDALKGISYGLQLSEQVVPRFILVGIGYPSSTPWAGAVLRARDFTFPGFPNWIKKPIPWEGVLVAGKGTKSFAGGEDFQRFIADELIPFVDAHYRTLPGQRTYFGHSAGATFGLVTMFNKPEIFDNYIIASPALVFDGDDFGFREVQKFLTSGKSLPGIRLYLSAGTEEEFDPRRSGWQFTSSFYRLASLMKAKPVPGLKVMTEALAGETHMTVWPIAYIHGIQAVFATGAWKEQ